MSTFTGKTILGTLLPLVANPTALAAIGIGAAGWAIYSLCTESNKSENDAPETFANGSEPLKRPLAPAAATVDIAVPERLNAVNTTVPATDSSTDDEPFYNGFDNGDGQHVEAVEPREIDDEQAKKEMIRKTMSELGKRSAAARARKRESKE